MAGCRDRWSHGSCASTSEPTLPPNDHCSLSPRPACLAVSLFWPIRRSCQRCNHCSDLASRESSRHNPLCLLAHDGLWLRFTGKANTAKLNPFVKCAKLIRAVFPSCFFCPLPALDRPRPGICLVSICNDHATKSKVALPTASGCSHGRQNRPPW